MKRTNKPKRFRNENEERSFWARTDSTEYVDWSGARKARFPNLKPTTKSISIRMPAQLLDDIKTLAHKRDVPYQSLVKMLLADSVARLRTAYGWNESEVNSLEG